MAISADQMDADMENDGIEKNHILLHLLDKKARGEIKGCQDKQHECKNAIK
jgi:hypothetical protein